MAGPGGVAPGTGILQRVRRIRAEEAPPIVPSCFIGDPPPPPDLGAIVARAPAGRGGRRGPLPRSSARRRPPAGPRPPGAQGSAPGSSPASYRDRSRPGSASPRSPRITATRQAMPVGRRDEVEERDVRRFPAGIGQMLLAGVVLEAAPVTNEQTMLKIRSSRSGPLPSTMVSAHCRPRQDGERADETACGVEGEHRDRVGAPVHVSSGPRPIRRRTNTGNASMPSPRRAAGRSMTRAIHQPIGREIRTGNVKGISTCMSGFRSPVRGPGGGRVRFKCRRPPAGQHLVRGAPPGNHSRSIRKLPAPSRSLRVRSRSRSSGACVQSESRPRTSR